MEKLKVYDGDRAVRISSNGISIIRGRDHRESLVIQVMKRVTTHL